LYGKKPIKARWEVALARDPSSTQPAKQKMTTTKPAPITIALAQLAVSKAAVDDNLQMHLTCIERAAALGANVVAFPELSLTGYELALLSQLAMPRDDATFAALTAAAVAGSGEAIGMRQVTWYRRSPEGAIVEQIRAPIATYAAPGWRLEDATRFEVASAGAQEISEIVVGEALTPEQVDLAQVDPDTVSFWNLSAAIDRYEAAGRRTAELRAKWWHKLSGPLSAVLMPLLGSVAAFGLARSGQLFVRALIGMALGFAYFVVDNAALAMGNFGGYPPYLAAWAPFLLFFLLGETVLIRTEE
jgi:hypothetical protein